MRVARRGIALAGLVGAFVLLGTLLNRPLLLVGGGTLAAWLIGVQFRFLRELEVITAGTSASLDADPQRGVTGRRFAVQGELSTAQPSPVSLTATLALPVTARSRTIEAARLDPEEKTALATAAFELPVAGEHTVTLTDVEATDSHELFTATIPVDETITVTAEPPATSDLHVGQGGDQAFVASFGDRTTGQTDTGIEPVTVREYAPGDTFDRIDWRATARLQTPHVREFERESERPLLLVIDSRVADRDTTAPDSAAQSVYPPLAYAREVGFYLLETARAADDPIGLYIVSEAGLTTQYEPRAGAAAYQRVRTALHELAPSGSTVEHTRTGTRASHHSPTASLRTDESAFGRALSPFLEMQSTTSVTEPPLLAAIQTAVASLRGTPWVAMIAPDTQAAEFEQAVELAVRQGAGVSAFVLATPLFEPDALGTLEQTYTSYRETERFRRSLASLPDVDAFEVAPSGQLERLLRAPTTESTTTDRETTPQHPRADQ